MKLRSSLLALGALTVGLGIWFATSAAATTKEDKEPNGNWSVKEQRIKDNGPGKPRKNLHSETIGKSETRTQVKMDEDQKKPDFSTMKPEKSDSLN